MNIDCYKSNSTKWILSSTAALFAMLGTASAQIAEPLTGDPSMASSAPVEETEVGSAVSGSISFDFNSHFISYGLDVWAEGQSWDNLLFNPSASVTFDFDNGLYAFGGLWFDINGIGTSGIGDDIQEIDVWAGLGYSISGWTFEVTYQEWIYASDVERILDFMVAYDIMLNPTLIVHNRVDVNGGQSRGTVFVLGISEGWDVYGVDVSLGADIAFNTDDYYGLEGGFTYLAVGPQASVPLPFIGEQYGAWNIHGGLTYYYTNNDTVPNPKNSFVTGNIGVGVDF